MSLSGFIYIIDQKLESIHMSTQHSIVEKENRKKCKEVAVLGNLVAQTLF